MNIQNLHTHTTFCDGADTPEEMVLAAIDKGFNSLGFSGHSYMSYSDYCGFEDKTEEYKKEVVRLKNAYKDKFEIYLGLEVDMYSAPDMKDYDYLIGSLHYFKLNDKYVGFDRGKDQVKEVIDRYFDGDGMKYAKRYYEELAELPKYGSFDIIGHFDLITKHSESISFFDEEAKAYLDVAFQSADALAEKIPLFEVNTGAISRGYRTTPYPSIPILKHFKELGLGAVITSDCHDKGSLDCNFKEATELLKYCGFKEKYVLTKDGFKAVSL